MTTDYCLQTEDLSLEHAAGVLQVKLNRPAKKNALNYAMYADLCRILQHAASDNTVRALLLTGTGDYFSAGSDISDFQRSAHLHFQDKPSFQFMNTLAAFSKPIVAAVNGHAVGIGVTLLLHCDLVYAARGVSLRLPFLPLGLVPEFGSTKLLPSLLGHQKAAELLMLGEPFDSERAEALGLVNGVLDAAELMERAQHSANTLASRPQVAMQATKRLMRQGVERRLPDVIEDETQAFTDCLRSDETQATFAALLGKADSSGDQ